MYVDIEESLGRELREVADGLQVPPRPRLPRETVRPTRTWQPLLVAAAVVLLVAGTVAVLVTSRDGGEPEPAPSPTPTRIDGSVTIPTTAPTVTYVLDSGLYVGGERVPGDWSQAWAGPKGWVAIRTDGSWWWGWGTDPQELDLPEDAFPVLSPRGTVIAETLTDNQQTQLTGFETRVGGEGLGGVPIEPGSAGDGSQVRVRAVTDDGLVIAQGTDTAVLWRPLVDNRTVDLTQTAPDVQVLGNTPAGLLITDGSDGAVDGTTGAPYLAEVAEDGTLVRVASVPTHDDLLVSTGGTWLAYTPPGTTGGEVTSIGSFEVQPVGGSDSMTLTAPDGWGFTVRAWAWEDDDRLVSPVVRDGGGAERMARCSVRAGRCVLVEAP
ncbi:hypothetical protein [Nocardioides guangzhouensis]|uniref:hypothetical protein n=1 Tax=Nocardioides guangzhouensis TaxID=2497878 RepID=UPI0014386864|nr:hypothetical protein [Nocardioides guangzhouensis]